MTANILYFCAALALWGCGGITTSNSSPKSHEGGADTVYTEPKAMSIHRTDPERALVMVDSAAIVGNVTRWRSEYLKAIIYYSAFQEVGKAEQICFQLLDDMVDRSHPKGDGIGIKSGDVPLTRDDSITALDTYTLLTVIAKVNHNLAKVIEYASEATPLARALGETDCVGRYAGDIAYALAQQGRVEEGIAKLHKTIDELKTSTRFNHVSACHSVSNLLVHILTDNEIYDDAAKECKDMLARYDEFTNHPDRFTGITDDFDPSEFLDFARGSTLSMLAYIYSEQGKVNEARQCVAELKRTQWGQTVDSDRILISVYSNLREWQSFDEAVKRLEVLYTDTISSNYYTHLTILMAAAEQRGRIDEAYRLAMRADVIKDSLHNRDTEEQLAEQATIYHLQEEKFARQEAEADSRFFRLLTMAIVVGLVAAVAFAIYFFIKRRETMNKNKVLARMIAESINRPTPDPSLLREGSIYTQGQNIPPGSSPSGEGVGTRRVASDPMPTSTSNASPSSQEETTPLPHREGPGVGLQGVGLSGMGLPGVGLDTDLYAFLRKAIMSDQLFLDPQLDRQALVDRFGLSKDRIGAAFAKGSPYKSLIDFLTDCRLPYAAKMLTERPDLTIAEIAMKSGFPSLNTFGRNFKQKYAITPSQFREQQEKAQ